MIKLAAILCLAVFAVFAVTPSEGKALPSYITKCNKTDTVNFESCLKNLVYSIRPRLAVGIPELRLPPIDPFFLPQLSLYQNSGNGATKFKANFKNVTVHGSKDFTINHINIDFNNTKIDVNITLPKIRLACDYEIDGKMLVVVVKGNGKLTGTFTDINARVVLTGHLTKKKNKKYINLDGYDVSFKLKSLRLHFSDLFNGNKDLTESTNAFINQNWREAMDEIRPIVNQTVGDIMSGILRGMMDQYSIEEIFSA
jgi:hypothetical protein